MAKTATLHIRIDQETKENAQAVFEALGMNIPEAITLYFKQVALNSGLPFELKIPQINSVEFVDCFGIGGNMKKINPLKQIYLKRILEAIPPSLDELWVFGSAVTNHCKPASDLDICLVGNTTHEEDKAIYNAAQGAVDIIKETSEGFQTEQEFNDSIYREVKNTGVLLYKKGVGIVNG